MTSIRRLLIANRGEIAVRVIRTDEESMIATTVCRVLHFDGKGQLS